MRPASPITPSSTRSHKPRAFTVFAAAFVAGAAAAVGVNSVLDVRLAQAKPRVESEPIFVALRSLPQGSPVTVWDVALRDWPRAMVPTSALRASDTFSGLVLRHPLREGQPLLSIQLVEADATTPSAPVSVTTISNASPPAAAGQVPDADLWAPAAPATITAVTVSEQRPPAEPQPGLRQPPAAQAARAAEQPAVAAPVTDAAVAAPVVPPVSSPAVPSPALPPIARPNEPAMKDTVAVAPVISPETVAIDAPRQPPAEDVAATASSAAFPVAAPAMPTATPAPGGPDTTAFGTTGGETADTSIDAFTDEILEAMATLTAPAVESLVTPPTGGIAPPAADATGANDRGSSQASAPDRPDATATESGAPVAAAAPVAPSAGDPVAMQPTPTPTLADPPAAPIGGQATDGDDVSAAPASVMRPATADTAPAVVPAPPRVARYLVVPESIALQADASFAAARQPTALPAPRSGGTAVQPLPSTGGQQPAQQRASQPRRGTAAASGSGPRPSAPQQTADQQRRGGMFPNIAAGVETLDAELGRIRRGRASQAEQPSTTRPRPQY